MLTTIRCPHCQRQLGLQETDAGKMVQCPACTCAFTARPADEAMLPPFAIPVFETTTAEPPRGGIQSMPSAPKDEPVDRRPAEPPPEVYAVELELEATASSNAQRRRRVAQEYENEADVEPHRGILILVLGLLSVVLCCFPPAGWGLGGFSMVMASHDERLMEARVMDRTGWVMTRAGHVCGIIGVFLASVFFIVHTGLTLSALRH